jgi:hypothetical protein
MIPHLRTPIICLAALAASALPDAHGTAKLEKFWGYAEFVKGDTLIVDGQRVVAGPHLKLKVANISVLSSIPLGYEVKVKGQRAANGALVADEVEGRPNGTDGSEQEIIAASDQAEQTWVDKKMMFEPADSGKIVKIGDILESGPEVDRVRRIMDRLRPSYVPASALRVRVVKTDQWNASAMANGAVWVFTGSWMPWTTTRWRSSWATSSPTTPTSTSVATCIKAASLRSSASARRSPRRRSTTPTSRPWPRSAASSASRP